MPQQSARESRKELDKLSQDLQEQLVDWEITVDDVEKVLDKYDLSKRPEDLQALMTHESDIHQFNVDLQEYFKDDMDILQQIESVAIEGFTATKRAAKTIREEAEARSPEAEKSKEVLRNLLVKFPLVSLDLDQDDVFGEEFHEATKTQIRELTAKLDHLTARMIRDRDQIHAELRAELKIEHFEVRFQGYCALAEVKITQAVGECDRLRASESKFKKSLTAKRKKIDDLYEKIADIGSRLADAQVREDGKDKQLALLEELNDTRKGAINTMQASLDEKDAKIRGLESDVRSLKAAQEESQARATAAIDERDNRIRDLDVAATQHEAAQSQSEATIAKQAQELQHASAASNARDTRIRDLDVAADERDRKVKSLEAKVSQLELANGEKDADIQGLEEQVQGLQKARDTAVADARKRITEIRYLESAAEEHSRADQSLNDQLSALRASINAKDRETADLRETVKTKDGQLTESQASVKAKDEVLAHLRRTIKDKNQEAATLRLTVDDDQRSLQTADDEAATRRQLLLEKNNEIATLKSEVATRRQLLLENNREIAALKSEVASLRHFHRGDVTAKDAEITKRKRALRSAIGMMVSLLSDSTSIPADDYIARRLEKMFLDTSDIPVVDLTSANQIALPSLRISDVAQKSSTNHILCLFMAVYCGRNSGEINRHAQGVLDAAQQIERMKDWVKVIVHQMIQRSLGEEDKGQGRILWIIAMQYILLFSSLVPGDGWLVGSAIQVNAAVDQTSSPALHFMMGQLLSSLANAQTNGNFAWLSGYHAGADQLDDSNSALPQGTRIIGEAPDLFFLVNTGGLTVFTADDVETVSLDMKRGKGWELKLTFEESASVGLDSITLSMNVNRGPPFEWAMKFLLSKAIVFKSTDP
ncbi:MAG: hypothetical protein Q9173_004078 [Seirophora scorigena]